VQAESIIEEKTVGVAGTSRLHGILKSILNLEFAPRRSLYLNWNSRRRPCSIRLPRFILVGATHSPSTGSSRGTAANPDWPSIAPWLSATDHTWKVSACPPLQSICIFTSALDKMSGERSAVMFVGLAGEVVR